MKTLITKEYRRSVRYILSSVLIVSAAFLYNTSSPTSPHKTIYFSGKNSKTAVEELKKYTRKAELMKVVIFAGETSAELCKRLANDMKLDETELLGEYQKHSRFIEADIFAQSYTLARDADAFTVMQYLFERSDTILSAFEKKYFSQKPKHSTIRTLLTIASIIQKESNSVKEMPFISSVIYNRLKKKMKLQMDCTLNYGKYSHIVVTPDRIKNDRTSFNTYKYKGLPPHPLGTVTINALESAMMPEKSEYLFFMLTPEGEHTFSVTYEEHLKNIKIFRAYQNRRRAQKEAEHNATAGLDVNKTKIEGRPGEIL